MVIHGAWQMIRLIAVATTLALLTACGDGQPFFDDGGTGGGGTDGGGDGGGGGGGGVGGDGSLPPGTDDPSSASRIFRYEAIDANGGGYVRDVSYNATDDTFSVDNLAFDGGANVYQRGTLVSSMGKYAVYEADALAFDSVTGKEIEQLEYRAIYGVSKNTTRVGGADVARSRFAIVRTGSYQDYGFGGFVYERNGEVKLPTTGQATYRGDYAGIRVFQNLSNLEYTSADLKIDVDFDDFNTGSGVKGVLTNRKVFSVDGSPVTTGTGDNMLAAPPLRFVIQPGVLDTNGEMTGSVESRISKDDKLEVYETGKYYGIIGGPRANEIVGVIVMESEDPRFEGVTAQETGGFIVYR